MQNSGGMSRAAKRRRKEMEKHQNISKAPAADEVSAPKHLTVFDDYLNGEDITIDSSGLNIKDILDKVEVDDILSDQRAAMVLSAILAPTPRQEFYGEFWNKKPLYISNDKKLSTFDGVYNRKCVVNAINRHVLHYPDDIILGKYKRGAQKYHSRSDSEPPVSGNVDSIEVSSDSVWKAFSSDYGFELHNLQKYDDVIWRLLSALEPEFNAPIKCDITVTSTKCQSFGPQLSDGDQLLVQVEGSAVFKVYGCPDRKATSSEPETIVWPPEVDAHRVITDPSVLNAPHMEVEVEEGGVLYVPRGWVVECAPRASHATTSAGRCAHLTISTNHSNNLFSIVELMIPQALLQLESQAWGNGRGGGNDVASLAVRALPRSFISTMGVARSEEDDDQKRHDFRVGLKRVLDRITQSTLDMLDPAADQHAKRFICARLPVPLSAKEEQLSSAPSSGPAVHPYTKLRMLRPGIARALVEDGMVVVYHCMDNSREMYGSPINPLEFELDDGPAIEMLLDAYPTPVAVLDLPHPSEELEDKVAVAEALFKEGFLVIAEDPTAEGNNNDSDEEGSDDDNPF